jgi:hypothetical protein
MSDYQRAERYRVAYFATGPKSGKTAISVILETGFEYVYDNLSPETAHHLIDLLRNENPIWVDRNSGRLVVADEPIGSGE